LRGPTWAWKGVVYPGGARRGGKASVLGFPARIRPTVDVGGGSGVGGRKRARPGGNTGA